MADFEVRTLKRFVILNHQFDDNQTGTSHWDLMLELDGKLLTWQLAAFPELYTEVQQSFEIPAQQINDHRIDYLELEGPVSGNRGTVRRECEGTYEIVSLEPLIVRLFPADAEARFGWKAQFLDVQRAWEFELQTNRSSS